MTEQEAANIFVTHLIARAYHGAATSVLSILSSGPATKSTRESVLELSEWYTGLDENGRDQIRKLVYEVARQSTFGACVVLDGASGGNPIKGRPSRFSLTLEEYANDEMTDAEASVRINDGPEDLHDIFHDLLEAGSIRKPGHDG